MKKRKIIVIFLLTVLIVSSILFYVQVINKARLDTWISLTIPDKGEVGYKPVAVFNDIRLPEISKINGDVKFISRDNFLFMGYKINFEIAHLDTAKVPKKYLIDKQDTINGVPIMVLGLKEVIYKISFEFTLLDKDGFKLDEIKSGKEYIESGKRNEIQNMIEISIPLKIIELTKSIELALSIDKCVSCDN